MSAGSLTLKVWRSRPLPGVSYHPVTQINGWLADQTALSGLLDLLNDLGRVILTVERLEMDEEVE